MFDSSDSFGIWIIDGLGILGAIAACVFFGIWVLVSFFEGAAIMPEYKKAISSDEMKAVLDTYLVSKDHFVELGENKKFRDVYNGQENKGEWSQDSKILTLTQENGSKTELCIFFDSDVLLGVSGDCPCDPLTITKKSCWENKLIRKGAIADFIPSN